MSRKNNFDKNISQSNIINKTQQSGFSSSNSKIETLSTVSTISGTKAKITNTKITTENAKNAFYQETITTMEVKSSLSPNSLAKTFFGTHITNNQWKALPDSKIKTGAITWEDKEKQHLKSNIKSSYQSPFKATVTDKITTNEVPSYISPYRNSSTVPNGLSSLNSMNKTFNFEKQNLPVKCRTSSEGGTNTSIPLLKTYVSSPSILQMKKGGPGILYIFHHDEFQDSQKEFREGSRNDVELLKKTFSKYKVKTVLCDNYTVKKIKSEIEKVIKKDFTKNSCIVVAILSHGNRHETISAKDGNYSINDDILFPILRNKTLVSKPKILLVQACKGDFDLRGFRTDSFCSKEPVTPDEIYRFYSTSEGFVSFRNVNGSVFIREFCDELNKSGDTKNICHIMELVIKKTKLTTGGKQIPSMCVNNTLPYVFGSYAH